MGFLPEHDFQVQAQRWRLHVEQTPLAVIEWDMEGRVQSWNPAAERMFGYSAAEAIGQPIIDLIVPPKAAVLEQVHHLAEGLTQALQPSHAEHENKRKDGSLILCRWFNTPLTDEAGQSLGVASMALDVTELQRMNQALKESEQRFRTVADFTHDWEYWVARDGSIPWMSPSCELITGYSVEAFQRDPGLIYRICHPEDRALVLDHVHEAMGKHGVYPIEFRIQHRDGHQIWFSHICAPVLDGLGNPTGRRVTNRDITDRKRAEDIIRKISTAVDQSPVSVVITDTQGAIEYVNPMFTKITGYSLAEALGQNPRILKSGDKPPEAYKALWDTLCSGETWQGEFQNKKKNGELYWEQASISPIRNDRGVITSFVAVKEDISERKKGETALLEAHQFTELIINRVQEGLIVYGLDLRYQVWNPFMAELTGLPASDVLGKHPLEVFPFLRETEVMDRLGKALAGEPQGPLDVPYRVPSTGKSGWITHISSPFRNPEGEIIGVVATVSDINERKHAESLMQESEQRFRTVFEKAIDGIAIFNLEGEILYVNETFAQMHGYTREEMRGFHLKDIDTPESSTLAPGRIQRMLAGEMLTVELGQIHKDGHIFITEATGSLVSIAGKPVILSFHRDITERKRAEKALRQAKETSKHYLDVVEAIMVAFDTDAHITLINRKGNAVLGYEDGELIGQNWLRVCLPPEEYESVLEVCSRMSSGDIDPVKYHENYIVRKNGEKRLIAWHNAELMDDNGKFIGMLSSGEDITDRKRAEEERASLQAQLLQSQKMESLGTLAGGIAHDMNNVLGAILGLASVNLEAHPSGSPTYRAFDTISKAATRGGEMIKSLLTFARQSRAEERELDLNAILQEEVRLLERTTLSKVCLELDLEPGLRPIRGDAGALTNVFMNLCVNAVDAMPENGTLTLRTRNVDSDGVEVLVGDTGIGMPKEVLERALEPFYTTKGVGKGTGLGLSMVFSTVKAHKGQMEIQSEPGRGTQVSLRFPSCEPAAEAMELGDKQPLEPSARTLNVLLVDDDELVQSSVQALLQALGHATFTAPSGEGALEAIEAGFEPDVVILDMNMPGLGGSGTLPRLRALLPEVPVLLATGRADQAALDLTKAHPHVTLLPKPYTLKELQQRLEASGRG